MLTLDEVKKYLRVDFSDEDTLITSLISTQTPKYQRLQNRS